MKPLHLEVLYSGDHNLSCYYMAEVVKVVASTFPEELRWEIVYILKKDGAKRFYDLSVSLYGEENVRKHHCCAPVPSLFIDGRLVFDQIPPVEELTEVIRRMLEQRKLAGEGQGT
ncbi:MAG: hypothetical protein AB1523_00510 [Bacillota bacterium]